MAIQFASNAENKIDACVDYTRPSLILQIKEIKKAFHDARERGIKLRYNYTYRNRKLVATWTARAIAIFTID